MFSLSVLAAIPIPFSLALVILGFLVVAGIGFVIGLAAGAIFGVDRDRAARSGAIGAIAGVIIGWIMTRQGLGVLPYRIGVVPADLVLYLLAGAVLSVFVAKAAN